MQSDQGCKTIQKKKKKRKQEFIYKSSSHRMQHLNVKLYGIKWIFREWYK